VPFADGPGGVAFSAHAVENGGGVRGEAIDGGGPGEIVDVVFVSNPLLVGTGDDGGAGGRADRRGVGVGEKSATIAQDVEIRGGDRAGGLAGVRGLEKVVHEFPVGVAGIVRDDDDNIGLLGNEGGGEENGEEGGKVHRELRRLALGTNEIKAGDIVREGARAASSDQVEGS